MYHERNFGEELFCGTIKRRAARKTAFLSHTMSDICDYVVVYSRGSGIPVSVAPIADDTRPVFNEGNKSCERSIAGLGLRPDVQSGVYEKGTHTTCSPTR